MAFGYRGARLFDDADPPFFPMRVLTGAFAFDDCDEAFLRIIVARVFFDDTEDALRIFRVGGMAIADAAAGVVCRMDAMNP